jgi:hypothetical protein
MGVALIVLGAALHIAAIVLRGVAADRWPLGNMYDYVAFATFIAVAAWLVTLARFPVRRLSVWILIHRGAGQYPADGISTGVMVVPGVGRICYLIQSANQPGRRGRATILVAISAGGVGGRAAYYSFALGWCG